MTPWRVRIVDSCTGREEVADMIAFAVEDGKPLAVSFSAKRSRRGVRSSLERTPTGAVKYRWRCPSRACKLDVTMSQERLERFLLWACDTRTDSIELRVLSATLQ